MPEAALFTLDYLYNDGEEGISPAVSYHRVPKRLLLGLLTASLNQDNDDEEAEQVINAFATVEAPTPDKLRGCRITSVLVRHTDEEEVEEALSGEDEEIEEVTIDPDTGIVAAFYHLEPQ